MRIVIFTIAILSFFSSCQYFIPQKEPMAIARVGQEYLYQSDIRELVPENTSEKDSLAIVKNYINRWARQKLLVQAAEVNLNETTQKKFTTLVNQYKTDLYTTTYLEELVKQKIDTVVTAEEITTYYTENKAIFKNTKPLVKLRYINLVKENPKFTKIKSKFTSFTPEDKKELAKMAIQFKSYALNDSIWVNMKQVYERLPFINEENEQKYITNGSNYQYVDTTSIWLVKIKDVISKGNISPLEFVQPTIKQIIINKRKLELIKKIEKEITNDAIKNKKYEIYK